MQLIDFFSEKWQVRREYLSALHKSQKVWGIVFTWYSHIRLSCRLSKRPEMGN